MQGIVSVGRRLSFVALQTKSVSGACGGACVGACGGACVGACGGACVGACRERCVRWRVRPCVRAAARVVVRALARAVSGACVGACGLACVRRRMESTHGEHRVRRRHNRAPAANHTFLLWMAGVELVSDSMLRTRRVASTSSNSSAGLCVANQSYGGFYYSRHMGRGDERGREGWGGGGVVQPLGAPQLWTSHGCRGVFRCAGVEMVCGKPGRAGRSLSVCACIRMNGVEYSRHWHDGKLKS